MKLKVQANAGPGETAVTVVEYKYPGAARNPAGIG